MQDYTGEFSVVQSNNFSTLFILSREQHPKPEVVDVSTYLLFTGPTLIWGILTRETFLQLWIERAGLLGSDLSKVVKTDQTGCKFT